MSEAVVAFLYDLMRDKLPAGEVESMVQTGEQHPPPYTFSNPHLEAYARELELRMRVDAPLSPAPKGGAFFDPCTGTPPETPESALAEPAADEGPFLGRY